MDRMEDKKPIAGLPRDTTLGGVKKMTFVPNIAKATVKQEKPETPQDIPPPLATLNTIAPPKPSSNMRPKRPGGMDKHKMAAYAKPSGPILGMPSLSPFGQGLSSASNVKGHSSDIPLHAGQLNYDDYEGKPMAKHTQPEIDPFNILHPITIPFNDPRKVIKEYTLEDAERDLERSALEIDKEEKKIPLDLPPQPFHDEANNFLDNDNLFFIQLPGVTLIPPLQSAAQNAPQNAANAAPTPASSSTAPPPPQKPNEPGGVPPVKSLSTPGKLGRLVVHKSGRVRMQVGEIWYDVSATNKMKFLEEVMAISDTDGSCVRLGQLDQHLIVVPDVGHLFNPTNQKS
eukprot:TRINITY_DN6040_c0_g1_i1.p1 TRINITY_DN6040_c0_g1~~TRINITY_DN6040_c0_g1_i1.p1  ORF type:complete len:343 (-),score=77.37 TRINITY_DN6040_c0_g1_i1:193-1221(-)